MGSLGGRGSSSHLPALLMRRGDKGSDTHTGAAMRGHRAEYTARQLPREDQPWAPGSWTCHLQTGRGHIAAIKAPSMVTPRQPQQTDPGPRSHLPVTKCRTSHGAQASALGPDPSSTPTVTKLTSSLPSLPSPLMPAPVLGGPFPNASRAV